MTRPLPRVRFDLPKWDPEVLAAWGIYESSARELSRRAGTGRNFDVTVADARALLESGDEEAVAERLTERRFARAVVTVWAEDAELARRTMTSTLLRQYQEAATGVSRLTTIGLARLMVTYFDVLDDWDEQLFDALAAATAAAVTRQAVRQSDVVETFRSEGSYMLHRQGPRTLARHLKSTGTGVATWIRSHHLADGGRFRRAVMYARYLTDIEDADPRSEDLPFIAEVIEEATKHLPALAGAGPRRFGHDVLEAMLAKDVRRPSAAWLNAILTIAGDPRHRGTERWDRWWARIEQAALARALSWMSAADLRTFLQAVEHYGRSTGKADLTRMLTPRKILLDRLFESGRIRETRLILGADVARAIAGRAVLSDYDSARYIEAGALDKSLVVVDCGGFTLVEGSHIFKLYVFVGRPPDALLDRGKRHFTLDDIRYDLSGEHIRRNGLDSVRAFAHNGPWQRAAHEYLTSRGVRVDARIFSPS